MFVCRDVLAQVGTQGSRRACEAFDNCSCTKTGQLRPSCFLCMFGFPISFRDPPHISYYVFMVVSMISLGFQAYSFMALCDVPCYYYFRAKWHIRGTPSPFLRHQLALKQVTLRRWFPCIPFNPYYPVPARDLIGL